MRAVLAVAAALVLAAATAWITGRGGVLGLAAPLLPGAALLLGAAAFRCADAAGGLGRCLRGRGPAGWVQEGDPRHHWVPPSERQGD